MNQANNSLKKLITSLTNFVREIRVQIQAYMYLLTKVMSLDQLTILKSLKKISLSSDTVVTG